MKISISNIRAPKQNLTMLTEPTIITIQFLIAKKSRTHVTTWQRVNVQFKTPFSAADVARKRIELEQQYTTNGTTATAYTVSPHCKQDIN